MDPDDLCFGPVATCVESVDIPWQCHPVGFAASTPCLVRG
jgi:hypothetical protein